MASADDVDEVRRNTNINSDDETWPFAVIDGYVDEIGIVGATAKLWRQKAGRYADLCDISEAGAMERMSQLAAAARAQADWWDTKYDEELNPPATDRNARTYALEREAAS